MCYCCSLKLVNVEEGTSIKYHVWENFFADHLWIFAYAGCAVTLERVEDELIKLVTVMGREWKKKKKWN